MIDSRFILIRKMMYNSLNKHIGYHLLLRLEHVLSAHKVNCILESDIFHGEFVEHSVVC